MWAYRFVGAALALMAGAVSARAEIFNPTQFSLPNGLTVVVVENHRAPIVSHMVWYKVGAADEIPGKSGLAHLLEHLMFKGTPSLPPGEFSKTVAKLGGRDNAFTSSDYTAYFQNIAVEHLDDVMAMEADRMRNLTLDDANVLTERDVVQEERRSRTDNNPSALLYEQIEAALYLNHPYGRPIIGWASEVGSLTRQDALDFYRRWYAPNNAILVVAGDVTPDQVKAAALRHYGPVPSMAAITRQRVAEPPPVAARRVTLADARVRQPALSRLYLAPTYHDGDAKAGYALEILSEILGGGATSRLYTALVVQQKLAAAAHAWYEPGALDTTSLGLGATPNPGIGLEQLEAAMDKVVAQILDKGISAQEVARAQSRLISQLAYARDSLHTGARVLGEALTTGQTVADVEDWPNRIQSVTADDVNRLARRVLTARASVTGLLVSTGEAVPANASPLPLGPSRELH